MINENVKVEIKVQSFIWKQKMLIAGHYEFEIILRTYRNNMLDEKTIYRRFSDIEWVHEGLLKYNPGCRIPNLPEKNIWFNLNVNNNQLLEKRQRQIEEYLNYINNHKFLFQNPNFVIFLSDDFERIKNETSKSNNIIKKFSNFSSPYIPNVFRSQKAKGLCTIEDNSLLDRERENLVRLLKGITDFNENINEYIRINEEKTNAIRNILQSTRGLSYVSLSYNDNPQMEDGEDSRSKTEKTINKNMEVISNFYEKNKIYYNLVTCNIKDQLSKYEEELRGLIEIFERKEHQESVLGSLQKMERTEETEKEIDNQKYNLEVFNRHLIDEINNFKLTRENDLLSIVRKFFKDKYECEEEIKAIFN